MERGHMCRDLHEMEQDQIALSLVWAGKAFTRAAGFMGEWDSVGFASLDRFEGPMGSTFPPIAPNDRNF